MNEQWNEDTASMQDDNQLLKYILIIGACALIAFFFVKVVFGTQVDKVYWCHCEPNGNCQTLHLPMAALINAGHVNANGNPLHAGDHEGACVEPTSTPTPSPTTEVQPSPTIPVPTINPCDGDCQEVTPTPTIEVTPTPEEPRVTPTPKDEPLTPTTGNSGTGVTAPMCADVAVTEVPEVWLQPDAGNNGTLVVRWGTNQYNQVDIRYSDEPNNMDKYSLLSTNNDGTEDIKNLNNGTHYFFEVRFRNGCSTGNWSEKIDPLP
jgi:hypothetical protein